MMTSVGVAFLHSSQASFASSCVITEDGFGKLEQSKKGYFYHMGKDHFVSKDVLSCCFVFYNVSPKGLQLL